MPDSAAKKAWMKENSRLFAIKVMKRTEADIFDFLTAQSNPSATIKAAIREYMQNHKIKEQG